MNELVVRADASPRIGTGHVMRCLALAQAWQEQGGNATFVTTGDAPALMERLRGEGMGVLPLAAEAGTRGDAEFTARVAHDTGAEWLVLDGYHFDAGYQQAIKANGLKLLCVDDEGELAHYYADVVLNQNLHAAEGMYAAREPYTRLRLGTRYVMLRREFWKWRGYERSIPEVARRVLVTLGGSDPDNVTERVVHALGQVGLPGLEVVVVVGGSNPHGASIAAAIASAGLTARVERDVRDMPALMAWADAAVSGAGSTCWELAMMGLPSILLVLAENQAPIAERLVAERTAHSLGWYGTLTPDKITGSLKALLTDQERRRGMMRKGQELVDGRGTMRVVAELMGEKG